MPLPQPQSCPVCGNPAERDGQTDFLGIYVKCLICGGYAIGNIMLQWLDSARADGTLNEPLLQYLSCYTRQRDGAAKLTVDNWKAAAEQHKNTPEDEKIQKLIAYAQGKSKYVGDYVDIQDNDYPLFDTGSVHEKDALAQEALNGGLLTGDYPIYVVTKKGRQLLAARPVEHRIFVSHAADDAELAEAVANAIRERLRGVEVFVSSEPGAIRAGEKWLNAVETKLINGTIYLVLLTPQSVTRPWLWFETGSVWFLDRQIIPLCAGISSGDVPYPLGARQIYSLENADLIRELFKQLGADCNNPEALRELFNARLRNRSGTSTSKSAT